ncbi:MAG: hypothetical protein IJG23_04825 [Clostridia bacterium]|nr:hypothetical protein [Clostridia bacterium]
MRFLEEGRRKKPQIFSQYPLFTALCRFGATSAYAAQKFGDAPQQMTAGNVSVLSNGNVIIYDENAQKVLEFFSVQEMREATRDFPEPEKECDVTVLTGKKKIFFSFDSLKEKNIFWTVLNFERNNAAPAEK